MKGQRVTIGGEGDGDRGRKRGRRRIDDDGRGRSVEDRFGGKSQKAFNVIPPCVGCFIRNSAR